MGYTTARFLIVHSWDRVSIERAHAKASCAFPPCLVGPIMLSVVNNEDGFIVWTSGSKDGWRDAADHVQRIDGFIDELAKEPRPPRWIKVSSGEEVGDLEAVHGYDGNYDHRYATAKATVAAEDIPQHDELPSLPDISVGYKVQIQPPPQGLDAGVVGVATRVPGCPVDVRVVYVAGEKVAFDAQAPMTIIAPDGSPMRVGAGDVQLVGLPPCTVIPEVTKDGVHLQIKDVSPEAAALRTSLAAVIGVLDRSGGWLPHEDQETIRTARAVLAGGSE